MTPFPMSIDNRKSRIDTSFGFDNTYFVTAKIAILSVQEALSTKILIRTGYFPVVCPHRIIIELDKLLHNQLRNAMGNGLHLVRHHCFLLQD